MSFLQLAKKRYSVRKFSEKKVEAEKVQQILQAAQMAPTAHNNQPQRIIVIDQPELLERLKDATPYTFNAPLNFLICYDKEKSWVRQADNEEMGYVDAAIVTTHMMLAIEDLGLGSTWVGFLDPNKLKEIFSLPANLVPLALLPTGYPAETAKPSPLHEKRLALTDFVTYNK